MSDRPTFDLQVNPTDTCPVFKLQGRLMDQQQADRLLSSLEEGLAGGQHNVVLDYYRLLDSKDERDFPYKEAAPKLVNELSAAGAAHHEAVLDALSAAGIPAVVDPYLVRGLDYYNRTVFEVVPVDDERAQGTIGGG
ncbi:MAG TPA: hypothetical protein PLH93_11955, partial [Flavobacteriales bacterium]|nr:hypothetical protein [Flavobacteriales bacterium]